MDITFKRTEDLKRAAHFTFANMRPYYQRFAPDWDLAKVLQVTQDLDNFDILADNQLVGVMRLEFEATSCYLRDLQVTCSYQNQGIGQVALNQAKRLTLKANIHTLKLRVLKVSPAVTLYKRNGFVTKNEDARFYNMATEIY